jgi:hypothetical protein
MAMLLQCVICERTDVATSDVGPVLRGWIVRRDGRRVCPRCRTFEACGDDEDDEHHVAQEVLS